MGLGGGMVWAIGLDDFKNRCGDGPYPLLNVMKNVLTNGVSGIKNDHGSTDVPTQPRTENSTNRPITIDTDITDRESYGPPVCRPTDAFVLFALIVIRLFM